MRMGQKETAKKLIEVIFCNIFNWFDGLIVSWKTNFYHQ